MALNPKTTGTAPAGDNPVINFARNHAVCILPLSLSLLMLAACTPDGVGRGEVILPTAAVESQADSALAIETLSTRPWLVTGDDVLLRVSWSGARPAELRIDLNGQEVTAALRPDADGQGMTGLLSGLQPGSNRVVARHSSQPVAQGIPPAPLASLEITNYPITGPIISGPHEQPFYCQTQEFALVTGDTLGPPLDANCSVATRIDYVYYSADEQRFKPLTRYSPLPDDVAVVNLPEALEVPFIVRVETGTVNRAIYEIAMLHTPGDGTPDPFNRSPGWNGKLVYTHGGGCRSGWYQQGNQTGGVLREGLLAMGYAITSASLNVFGQNCNDLLASETHIMVKERFVEQYGVPVYTIGTGASGGSYQSHQTADNYPGVFDGIIVSSSFPDVTSATIFTLADARLLHYYFTQLNPGGFTQAQQLAISGFGSSGSIANLARGAARLDPIYAVDAPLEEQGGELSLEALQSRRFGPALESGVRATVYDHTVNVYGRADNSFRAARPLDNVGVQYGLGALNAGVITPQQFIDLNGAIGGFDRDMNHVPERHRADPQAARKAIESGRILFGGAGLRETPIIDYRTYTDHAEAGDIHMIMHQFSTRQRLLEANGHADNHVMQVGGMWGFTDAQPDLGDLFRAMDQWLLAMQAGSDEMDRASSVVNARPYQLTDGCWDATAEQRELISQTLSVTNEGRCGELYPVYSTPRQVAGAPLSNAIVSCQLKPVDPADYAVPLTAEQLAQLEQTFPDGVCDWSRPDASGASFQGTWLSFGPSPVNRLQ